MIGSGPPIVRDYRSDLEPSGWQLGAYTADRVRLAPGVTAEAGMRWDHQSWTPGEDQLSPRLNLVWESTRLGVFRVAWGRFAQSQGIWELPVEDGVREFAPAQWATHRVLSWERVLPSGLVVRTEAYSKTMTDLWPMFENLFEADGFLPAGAWDRVRVDASRAEARGLELALKRPGAGRWSWWASYVLSAVEDLVDGDWQPRSWDQRHAVNFSVNWQPGSSWNLNLAGTFHSGWPRTPVTAELVQQPDGTWQIVPERGERNSARYPTYRRLDLRVSRVWYLRRGLVRCFFDLANLTNADNQRATSRYQFWYQGGNGVEHHPDLESWVPILPSFGVVWEF